MDGEDKYYRLRELKRGLADVVVKVNRFFSRHAVADNKRLSSRVFLLFNEL